MPIKIDELYVYVADDADEEGIAAVGLAGVMTPLVTSRRRIAEGPLHDSAQELADMTGKRLRLVRFSNREELGTIEPTPEKKGNGQT